MSEAYIQTQKRFWKPNRNTKQERVWKPDYIILKRSLTVSWGPEYRTSKGPEPGMQNQKGSGNRSSECYRVLENRTKTNQNDR